MGLAYLNPVEQETQAAPRDLKATAIGLLTRHLLFLPVLLMGAWLRLADLDRASLWLDELGQAAAVRQPLPVLLGQVRNWPAMAPLDFLIGNVMQRISLSDFAVRFPAAMFGVLSLLLLYWLSCVVFNRRIALIGSFLLAIAPLHLFYSREARPYAILTCMMLATGLAFYYLWQHPSPGRLMVYIAIATAALYSHYYILLVLGVQWLIAAGASVLAWRARPAAGEKRESRALIRLTLGIAIAVVLFTPWIVYDLILGPSSQFSGTGRFGTAPVEEALNATLSAFGQIFVDPNSTRYIFLALWVLGAAVAVRTRRVGALFVALLPPIGIGLSLALVMYSSYLFAVRQFLFCLPFYLLAVALGADTMGRGVWALAQRISKPARAQRVADRLRVRQPLPTQWVLLTAVVVLSLLAAANAIQTNPADWQRRASEEGWRQVAQEISDYRQPGDVILIPRGCSDTGTSFPFYCIDFYQPELTPLIQTSGSLDQLKAQYAAAKGNVWIVLAPVYNKLFFKGNDQLRAWITQEGLRTDNFHLVDVAYPQSRKMGQLQDQLAPNRFKQITGTMEAGGDVLRLIRGTAAQPICLAGYPLNLQPGQEYLITFEYRAPSAIPGPMQVSVDAPDVNIPGRLFKYTARDLQPAWRTGYLPYWANGDPQIAGRARLIVRLDGVGSVELRNIRVYDSAPPAVVAARPTPSPMPAGLPSPTPAGLAPEQFKQLLGAGAAHGEILQVLRGSPEQPVALMAHPLTLTPGKHYRISFEYRAPTGTTGPFSVYVDAQDVGTPGRLFKYAAHDLPTNWRTASLQYTAGSDAPVATSARLIVRLDGLGSVEVRNIYVAEE